MREEPHPTTTAVVGAGGVLGRSVVDALAGAIRVVAVDPLAADLKRQLEGVDAVVHLSFVVSAPTDDDHGIAARNADLLRRVLDAAGDAGVEHLVLMSSAAVYGAWPNNPVPLTEDAPVRPNPGFGFAVQKAELERLAGEWVDDHPGATLTILRPAVPLDEEQAGFLADVLAVRAPVATGEPEVPMQFVHVDDLASAVAHVVARRIGGVFNVGADGWITAGHARALAGTTPPLRIPDRVQSLLARFGRTSTGVAPYRVHPWVVATDRLKASGWAPAHSNEEALVATTEGMPWSRLSPKRRQELALGATVVGVVAAAMGTVALARWISSRRRARRSR